MKTLIKIIGFISLFLISFGTLFKLMHWPGTSIMLIYGNLSFVLVFLPLYFIHRSGQLNTVFEKILNFLIMLVLMMIFSGATFKVMHWPGASLLLIFGTLFLCTLVLPMYIFAARKNSEMHIRDIARTVIIGIFITTYLILYAANHSREIMTTFVKLNNQQLNSIKVLDTMIETQKNILMYDTKHQESINEVTKGGEELYKSIEEIKTKLIKYTDGPDSEALYSKDLKHLNSKDNLDIPNQVMIGAIVGDKNATGARLRKSIEEYRDLILKEINKTDTIGISGISNDIKKILDVDAPPAYNGMVETWEQYMFGNTPIVGTLTMLTGLQHDVRSAESAYLNYLLLNYRKK